MCGICGIWGSSSPEQVNKMITAMHHRGPDDRGYYCDDQVTLGMTRLSIIDLSQTAHQPMCNPQKTIWIVYNGEVYNFQSEREYLEKVGYSFVSRSDTEVILHLYEHFGEDFLLRLRGMFALAVYDKRRGPGKEKLLLARDQFGIKPLLYARRGEKLIFASEIKAMLASDWVEPQIDLEGLRLLLTLGSVYQPHTLLQDVKMLPPSHRLVIDGNQERLERYWCLDIDRVKGLRTSAPEDHVEQVALMMQELVKMQMVSDVPIGAFLSGGVDSSMIVGIMARNAGKRIKTFSVGYGEEGSHLDETDDAKRTAEFLGTDHSRVVVDGRMVRDHLERIVIGLDQPSVDGVNSYFVSHAARQAVTVAVSGTGGDEIFAGYPWFIQMALYEKQSSKIMLRSIAYHALNVFLSRIYKKSKKVDSQLRLRDTIKSGGFLWNYGNTYHIFGSAGTAKLFSPEISQKVRLGTPLSEDIRACDELPFGKAVERVTALCLRGYTNNQLLRDIDATSMIHSLEVRVPFLDVPLVDLALSLPVSAKLGRIDASANPYLTSYRDSGSKKVLVDAGWKLGLLRPDIYDQPKRGFTMPFDAWLKGPLRDIMEDTLSESVTQARGLFNVGQITKIKQDFIDGNSAWSYPWLLMMIELWQRNVLGSGV